MTSYEMRQMADMIANSLAERLKDDDELLERLYPSKPMSIDEASEWLGIPVGTLYQKKDEIEHSKVGKRLVFTKRSLSKWLKSKDSEHMDQRKKDYKPSLSIRMVANG